MFIKAQAKRMMTQLNKKYPELEVGITVRVFIPDADRIPHNLLAVLAFINNLSKMKYKIIIYISIYI
jgi:hypothetical protein